MNNEPVALKVNKGEICYLSNEDDQSYGMWCPINYDTQHGFPEGTKFYTHPAKTLTDKEILELWNWDSGEILATDLLDFADAILRKAQEK